MAIRVRIPPSVASLASPSIEIEPAPAHLGELIGALEALHPGLQLALDSSSVNAAVNGEVVLHGRDATPLRDGDEVEFLVMFAGG
jgi:molybdopterin converting factor small subunit